MANRLGKASIPVWTSVCPHMALAVLTLLMLSGAASARTEVPYTLVGGEFYWMSDIKRDPTYVVADNGVSRYEASLNLSAWTTQLSATVVGTILEEAPPDAYTIDSAYAFAILADNFVITDLDNPHLTGTLDNRPVVEHSCLRLAFRYGPAGRRGQLRRVPFRSVVSDAIRCGWLQLEAVRRGVSAYSGARS